MPSAFPFASDLLAPLIPPPGDGIKVTDSYTVAAGDSLDLHGQLGFKLVVKNDPPVSLTIDGTVSLQGHHVQMYGAESTLSSTGQVSVAIGAEGGLSVIKKGAGEAGGVALTGAQVGFDNAGLVQVSAEAGQGFGLLVRAGQADIVNTGRIEVATETLGYGVLIAASGGTLRNDGAIEASGGLVAGLGAGGVAATNNGRVHVLGVDATGAAVGAIISAPGVNGPDHPPAPLGARFTNHGEVRAEGMGSVFGVSMNELTDLTNDGRIVAEALGATTSVGLALSTSAAGGVAHNDGVIRGDYAVLAADEVFQPGAGIDNDPSDDVLINTGKLVGEVRLGAGSDGISNTGRIEGSVDLGDGGDIYIGNRGRVAGAVIGGLGNDNLTGGNDGDVLYGDRQDGSGGGGDDVLNGMKGADSLVGGAGTDTLIGGEGADTLSGGAGDDVFRFAKLGQSGPAAADLIGDLGPTDLIDLHRIDADAGAPGDQAFHQVGAFTGAAGELTVAYDAGTGLTTISGDVDGDGAADLAITATGDQSGFSNFVL